LTNNYSKYTLSILFISSVLCAFSCQPNDKTDNTNISEEQKYRSEKAKKLITEYLNDTLLENASYKVINYGDLDSSFSNCLSNKDYVNLLLTYYDFIDTFDVYYEEISKSNIVYKTDTSINSDTIRLVKYLNKIDSVGREMKFITEKFKSEFNGWTISNQIEVNNALKTKTIINPTFYFDTSVSKIIKYFDDYLVNENYKNFKHDDISPEIFRRHLQFRTLKQ